MAELALTVCEGGAPFTGADTSKDIVPTRAAAKFDHTTLRYGDFAAESKKTFLSTVACWQMDTKRTSIRSIHIKDEADLAQSARSSASPLSIAGLGLTSRLEQLPYEIILLVLERLDISSLVSLASANSYIRGLVQELPDIQKIQLSVGSARALSQMYTTGTAKCFSLRDFMRAFTSSACGVCHGGRAFAVSFDLLFCRRVCYNCALSATNRRCLPVAMALKCFDLNPNEVVCSKRLARVPIPPAAQLKSGFGQLRGLKRYYHVDIIPLHTAYQIAMTKYKKEGGLLCVKLLINDYLMERSIYREDDTYSTNDVLFPGFAEGVQLYWKQLGVRLWMVRRILLTTLPFLNQMAHPRKIESGIWCEGCIRDRYYKPSSIEYQLSMFDGLRVYLDDTFSAHADRCPTAKGVEQGVLLKVEEEKQLSEALDSKVSTYWPRKNQAPSEVRIFTNVRACRAKWTAQRSQAWHSKALKRITDIGERDLRCKRQLVESTQDNEREGGNLDSGNSISINRISFKFSDEARKAAINQGVVANRSNRKTRFQLQQPKTRRKRRKLTDNGKVVLFSLQHHLENMPAWLSLSSTTQAKQSQLSLETNRTVIHWPRRREMIFKSGAPQLTKRHNETTNPVTLATHDHAQRQNYSMKEELAPFVDGLLKLGVSSEKTLVPGLWEMRVAQEVAEESDENSVASGAAEHKDGEPTSDSDDEL